MQQAVPQRACNTGNTGKLGAGAHSRLDLVSRDRRTRDLGIYKRILVSFFNAAIRRGSVHMACHMVSVDAESAVVLGQKLDEDEPVRKIEFQI